MLPCPSHRPSLAGAPRFLLPVRQSPMHCSITSSKVVADISCSPDGEPCSWSVQYSWRLLSACYRSRGGDSGRRCASLAADGSRRICHVALLPHDRWLTLRQHAGKVAGIVPAGKVSHVGRSRSRSDLGGLPGQRHEATPSRAIHLQAAKLACSTKANPCTGNSLACWEWHWSRPAPVVPCARLLTTTVPQPSVPTGSRRVGS